MSQREVAKAMRKSPSTVKRLVDEGHLKGRILPGTSRPVFFVSDIEDYYRRGEST